ncbi:MAG: hypothetical protein ACXAC8_12175 [Candidatus Hodarchaeales archaeon]|jgi:hypothetical protein
MADNIEYVMIYQKSGLPIFSKCFSDFCMLNAKEPALLSGFLTALESFSLELVGKERDNTLESITMGNTTMKFKKTLPTGHSIVLGVKKDNKKMVEEVFDAIAKLIEKEYKNQDWSTITEDFGEEFEPLLYEKVLVPILNHYGGFHDQCKLGENCAIKTIAQPTKKSSIWARIRGNYQILKEKMKKKM